MFFCKICCESLLSKQEILSTFCGHLFHQTCLETQIINSKSTLCPTCHQSVNLGTTEESGYAVLPVYPEQDQFENINRYSDERMIRSKSKWMVSNVSRNTIIEENKMLKMKLIEIIQTLITIRRENKEKYHSCKTNDSFLEENPYTTLDIETTNSTTAISFDKRSKTHEPISSYIKAAQNLDLLNPELVAIWSKPVTKSLSEEEKSKLFRSKRREYLTWRNKAQSWLSKMKVAYDRIVQSENSFTCHEYAMEVRGFFTKIHSQGKLVDVAREAAMVYLIMDEVPENDKNEIRASTIHLTKSYSTMVQRIMDQLNLLENQNAKRKRRNLETSSENEPNSQSLSPAISNPYSHTDRCSYMSEDDHYQDSNGDKSPISCCSETLSSDYVFRVLLTKGESFFRDPIFV